MNLPGYTSNSQELLKLHQLPTVATKSYPEHRLDELPGGSPILEHTLILHLPKRKSETLIRPLEHLILIVLVPISLHVVMTVPKMWRAMRIYILNE